MPSFNVNELYSLSRDSAIAVKSKSTQKLPFSARLDIKLDPGAEIDVEKTFRQIYSAQSKTVSIAPFTTKYAI